MSKDTQDIEKKVIQILADKLDIEPKKIKPESKLVEDLGLDSFGAVELLFELKEKFGIEIPKENFEKIKEVEDITKYFGAYFKNKPI